MEIELNNLPNQSLTTTINQLSYRIELRYDKVMYFSLWVGDEKICNNVICFANQKILPYRWQERKAQGNFIFLNENDEYPHYENFNKTDLFFFIDLTTLKQENNEY